MKKIISMLCTLAVVLAFSSCSNNSPEGVVKNYYSYVQKGKYEKVIDLIHFKKEISSEEKQQYTALLGDKLSKELEKKDGISSYEVIDTEISEDGETATVHGIVTYGNGNTQDDKTKLVKVDGKWMIDSGK